MSRMLPVSFFIISQVLAYAMASCATLVFVLESPGTFVEFEVPPFMMVLDPPAPVLLAIRGTGLDFHLIRCCSMKSNLVPCGLSAINLLQSFSKEHPVWTVWHKNFQLGLCSLCPSTSLDSTIFRSQCRTVASFPA